MDRRTAIIIGGLLGIVGVLLMIAGLGLNFIPSNIGIFCGIACFFFGGFIIALGKRG